MKRAATVIAALAVVVGWLAAPGAGVKAQDDVPQVNYPMTIPMVDGRVYKIEVTSDQGFQIVLGSPKTIETARRRSSRVSGMMRNPDGTMTYSAKMENLTCGDALAGDWTLDIKFAANPGPKSVQVNVSNAVTN